jgi:branched-chain amino acid aminotransferase
MLGPMDDREGWIWFDGTLVPWRDARPHVLSHGLHYGSSVFEGERAYDGHVFRLRQHSRRLRRSAELLDFEIPWSEGEIDAATREVVAANNIGDGYIRPVAWRGSEVMGVSAIGNTTHLAIAAWPWPQYFSPEARLKGITLCLADWKRPSPETAPSQSKAAGLYMIATMAKDRAIKAGFDDALMLDWRGDIAEATGANVFLVIGGEIHTPRPDCFLDGITRQAAMELARRRGYLVRERRLTLGDLDKTQEMFLTGTAAEITPVREAVGRKLVVGAITRAVMEDFALLVRTEPKTDSAAALGRAA